MDILNDMGESILSAKVFF